ncbi:MAG: hypothetical protein P8Q14_06175 [Vicingaceae bacterium]|nr:hypothetical protein [Vicingaceae bacterium]
MKGSRQNIIRLTGFSKSITVSASLKTVFLEQVKLKMSNYNSSNKLKKNGNAFMDSSKLVVYSIDEDKCQFNIKAIKTRDILAILLYLILFSLVLIFLPTQGIENKEIIPRIYIVISFFFVSLLFFEIKRMIRFRDAIFNLVDQAEKQVNEN